MDESVMLSCALLYRGDVSPVAINTALDDWKRSGKLKFTDWSPCGFKVNNFLKLDDSTSTLLAKNAFY